MSLSDFLQRAMSKWMRDGGPNDDIALTSRIRIARNITDVPFPMLQTDSHADAVIDRVRRALASPDVRRFGNFELVRCSELSALDRQVLVEKHLISKDLADEVKHGAVALRDDEVVNLMINEEDHIRIQCIMPGLRLEEAWQLANELDDALEKHIPYAFHDRYGYLTACPTNVGTGIRASVMMHLPGLVLSGQINRMLSAVSQVGLTVRGMYGEGSESAGNLFQVSNQVTLGETEEEIIGNLSSIVNQLMDHERAARRMLLQENREGLEDRVCRSFGILAYARKMDSKETLQRLSDVRLGIDLGIIKGVSAGILKELMVMTQPAFLQKYYNQELSPATRDSRRATLIRERLRLDDTEVQ
ncbi:protein arginine kinase [Alicyclobacillus cycloheptanicus]|uniref:Protein-arginine kinase n=1 Tax=Alicyclobacillus cycloheptanicus TaxID=1457 RepID=A0ABT9XJ79_9BACL|nr:protein arginine kinase [Alicyclobacillus cycloheptanicus]MDQ0190374.1 protein arginine kinase [Alicyclobacillus cycloheptanicus]WDM02617.1 protein arginine kinase [Alicyclobacillus cycloheptanicus]